MHTLTAKMVCLVAVLAVIAGCKPKPDLTEQNAETLIPKGMSEAQVFEILGTNYTRAGEPNGQEVLLYFFKSYQPPKVVPKIDVMMVVISNGVVVGSQPQAKQ